MAAITQAKSPSATSGGGGGAFKGPVIDVLFRLDMLACSATFENGLQAEKSRQAKTLQRSRTCPGDLSVTVGSFPPGAAPGESCLLVPRPEPSRTDQPGSRTLENQLLWELRAMEERAGPGFRQDSEVLSRVFRIKTHVFVGSSIFTAAAALMWTVVYILD